MTDWQPITERPPLKKPIEMRNAEGTEVTGYAVYDGIVGRRGYWYWDKEATPSKVTSRYQIGGPKKFEPVAWRLHLPPRFQAITEAIGRREVEVWLERAILTEGTYRRPGHGAIRLSPLNQMTGDDRALIDRVSDENQGILETFVPYAWDHDNHSTVAMWLTKLPRDERVAVWLRAYKFSWDVIGDRLGRTRQTARAAYCRGVERAWSLAHRDAKHLRRLPREFWATRPSRHRS